MIRSAQNRKIKDIRRLLRSKGDLAVLEGTHLAEEALAAGIDLVDVLATPDFLATSDGRRLAARITGIVEVDAGVLDSLADSDSPRGIVAVARLPRRGVESLPRRDAVYVYAEALQDPGNLGALVRTCEAAGAAGLALGPGSAHPNHPRALRASAGSLLRFPVAVLVSPDDLASHLGERHPRWLAMTPRDGISWRDLPNARATVLLLGAEGPGLSRSLLERADLRVTIPLAAPVESLNATVAAALLLFELAGRRN